MVPETAPASSPRRTAAASSPATGWHASSASNVVGSCELLSSLALTRRCFAQARSRFTQAAFPHGDRSSASEPIPLTCIARTVPQPSETRALRGPSLSLRPAHTPSPQRRHARRCHFRHRRYQVEPAKPRQVRPCPAKPCRARPIRADPTASAAAAAGGRYDYSCPGTIISPAVTASASAFCGGGKGQVANAV